MATLIGVELRVGYRNQRQHEVKVFPVHIHVPDCGYPEASAEVTFHTMEGDVTTQIALPRSNQEFYDLHQGEKVIKKQIKEGPR